MGFTPEEQRLREIRREIALEVLRDFARTVLEDSEPDLIEELIVILKERKCNNNGHRNY